MSTETQDNMVKSGYAELDDQGRAAVREFIKQFEEGNTQTRSKLNESVNLSFNKSLGPKSSLGCPCCGK